MDKPRLRYTPLALKGFASNVFRAMGWKEEEADLAADVLVQADLRGVESHGMARLKGYVRLWDNQRILPTAQPRVVSERKATLTLDADKGLGLIVAPMAMKYAIQKAKQSGIGWVCVCNSSHFGIAAYHSMLALSQQLIGFAMTNASPLVAPTGSKERLLGTNPISVAIPARHRAPFVLDMATTVSANGKIERLKQRQQPIPKGWIQDKAGIPSTDPEAIAQGGALLPLGSDLLHSAYKGYGLASWVDIFSGVLSGANYGPFVPPFVSYAEDVSRRVGLGIGHCLGAFDPSAFRPMEDFLDHMDAWIERFKAATPISNAHSVYIPGEPECTRAAHHKKKGISLGKDVLEALNHLGKRFAIRLPEPIQA